MLKQIKKKVKIIDIEIQINYNYFDYTINFTSKNIKFK